MDSVIPLQYGATKLVLIGDPEQLPPTVLSKVPVFPFLNLLDIQFKHFYAVLFPIAFFALRHCTLSMYLLTNCMHVGDEPSIY